jgi:hypothetical protein
VGHDFSTTYPWKPHIPAAVGRCVVRRGPWKKHRRAACEAATVISEDKIVQRRAPKQRHRVVRPVTVTVKTVSLSQRCETCAAAVRYCLRIESSAADPKAAVAATNSFSRWTPCGMQAG